MNRADALDVCTCLDVEPGVFFRSIYAPCAVVHDIIHRFPSRRRNRDLWCFSSMIASALGLLPCFGACVLRPAIYKPSDNKCTDLVDDTAAYLLCPCCALTSDYANTEKQRFAPHGADKP